MSSGLTGAPVLAALATAAASEESDPLQAAQASIMSLLHQIQSALTENVVSRSVYGFFKGSVQGGAGDGAGLVRPEAIISEVDRAIARSVKGLARTGSPFICIAGLSGALAVAMGAYGAHVVYRREDIEEQRKEIYDRTNSYHFIHSLALLGVPLSRRPLITGSLLSVGTLLFCGTCYYRALTNDVRVRHITPYGGMLMILGWLSMAL